MAAFGDEEIERYSRHIVLRGIGGPGQQKIQAARILVIGAGGLGAPALLYLAAAGVGHLGIVDDDRVSLSNLQRQILFASQDIGAAKTAVAAARLEALNPHVHVTTHLLRISPDNAAGLLDHYDVIVDGSDNAATRYCVSDACFHARKPLVTGAVGAFDGALTTLRPFEKNADGEWNPTYRCLFPRPPEDQMGDACARTGVLGAMTGVIGSMMALEALREIVGFGESLVRKLVLFDAWGQRFETVSYRWDPDNPLNGVATASRA